MAYNFEKEKREIQAFLTIFISRPQFYSHVPSFHLDGLCFSETGSRRI